MFGKPRLGVYHYALIIALVWSLAVLASLLWDISRIDEQARLRAVFQTKEHLNLDIALRKWAASHGGVYVPATLKTPPNSHLAHVSERDVFLPSGKSLTLMNPAYMLRQVMEDYNKEYGVIGRITSLKPLRPENAPDEWEARGLLSLEKKAEEIVEFSEIDGKPYVRLLSPFITEGDCLKCHAVQGYRVGDIRGGISIAYPLEDILNIKRGDTGTALIIHISAWIIGLAGIIAGASVINRDIALKNMAEDGIREREGRIRLLLDSTAEGIFGIDREGRCVFCNSSCIEMLGYRNDAELLGKRIHDLIHYKKPDGSPHPYEKCRACNSFRKSETVHVEDEVFWRRDGSAFDVEYRSHRIVSNGAPVGAVVTFTDITERRRRERELSENRAMLARAQEIARLGNWRVNIETGEVTVTEEMYRIFGLPLDAPSPKFEDSDEVIHPDDRPAHGEWLRACLAGESPGDMEFRIIRPDNSIRVISAKAELECDGNKKPVFLTGTAQDITERKLLENQLAHAQRMESIGRLAGGVAHDFNNILSAINGYAELSQPLAEKGSQLERNIEIIRQSGDRAAELTKQLLAFSRKQVISAKIMDAGKVLDDMMKMLSRLIGEHIGIRLEKSENLWMIKADKSQMEQLVMNLVVNAKDSMPHGGDIVIRTENLALEGVISDGRAVVPPGRHVRLSVSDTGVGIPPEIMEFIFEPFFTTKETGKGTGLGLSIVYGIVKQHGGEILVESAPGRGATFSAFFPASFEYEKRHEESAGGAIPRGSETVIIAEDDKNVREFISACLKDLGYKVHLAENGRDALGILETVRADLLLTDVVMPGMNGVELAKKALENLPGLKALFISGYMDENIEAVLKTAGADKLIQKPVTCGELARKIRACLDSQKPQ